MAGLNCGTPSSVAWPALRDRVAAFVAIDDGFTIEAMRALRRSNPAVVGGESGAAGLGGLLAIMEDDGLRDVRGFLGLGRQSRVLVINTEGATDPEMYARVTSGA